MAQPLSFEQKEALSWLKLLGVALLVISMFIALIYFTTKGDEMMDKQAVWEASLTTEQIAHIEQMRAEFNKAGKATLFVTEADKINFIIRPTSKRGFIFFIHGFGFGQADDRRVNKKLLLSVTEIAHPKTERWYELLGEFAMQ